MIDKSKKCTACKKVKKLIEFYRLSDHPNGFQYTCKDCHNMNYAKYERTRRGTIKKMYRMQKANSKKREMPLPDYNLEHFIKWLFQNNFLSIYNTWKNSGYMKDMKPSVDRINDFLPYTFSNIKLGTWLDNKVHQRNDMINGVGTSGLRCKKVIQLDKNHEVIATYHSISHARRLLGYQFGAYLKDGKFFKRKQCYFIYAENV